MTDIISALYDDAQEYQSLLKRFGEEPSERAKTEFIPALGYLDYDHLEELRDRKRTKRT